MTGTRIAHINMARHSRFLILAFILCCLVCSMTLRADDPPTPREQFIAAWNAASRGDRSVFSHLPEQLKQYELFPYLAYEQLRYDRARVQPEVIGSFLEQHSDWAFAAGLRRSWLKTLGRQGKWPEFLRYYEAGNDTELRCYHARARLETGQHDGLLAEAQALWTAGKSQPDSCDPVFAWLDRNAGITADLAWERVFLAMAGGNARFTLYLARFLPGPERVWLQRWQDVNRAGYRNLGRSVNWPDQPRLRRIAAISIKQFAHSDAEKAWEFFGQLDTHFQWDPETRGSIIRDIALQSAVALTANAAAILESVPSAHRDDQLLQWWSRVALVSEDWASLKGVIDQMSPESRTDSRWRYWESRALEALGQTEEASKIRESLSREANYYGFLSADFLQKPYSICALEPGVNDQAILDLRQKDDISRALELRAAGLDNWALSEWSLAVARLSIDGLRTAAALAVEEEWHDRVIFALGNSGDRQFYDWRFPVLWESAVNTASGNLNLDAAWIHGVMRSESALAEGARSSAGALGLMQVTPGTARRLARVHGLPYRSSAQLKEGELNIRFGTLFMRDLLEKYNQNPVLVSGAYNAGPEAVDRWLNTRPRGDATIWVESIPYYETRDYIPRVLAFTTIYDWRLKNPVKRVSSRMPDLDSSTIKPVETTEVVCEA